VLHASIRTLLKRWARRVTTNRNETTAQCFRVAKNIRHRTNPLEREERPGTTEACLRFIEDEKRSVLSTQRMKLHEPFGLDKTNAAFELNWFDDECSKASRL